jgi:predicted small secreted protein
MNKNKLIIGIISLSLIASAFSFWVYRKKKNDESWRLIKLPDGVFKRNKNIKISRTN